VIVVLVLNLLDSGLNKPKFWFNLLVYFLSFRQSSIFSKLDLMRFDPGEYLS